MDNVSPALGCVRLGLVAREGACHIGFYGKLAAIARGRTDRARIEQAVGREIGGYLSRLENEHRLIAARRPVFAKAGNKGVRYALDDEFLRFWFRFVYSHAYMLEIGAFDALAAIARRDWDAFTGLALERWFRAKLAESGQWTRIGAWWDRKGENELDIVAENELTGDHAVCEVKRNGERIDLAAVAEKFAAFQRATGEWRRVKPSFLALSMDDM